MSEWLADPAFAAEFQRLEREVGLDLTYLGTQADAETIRDTQVAQPLLVCTALATAAGLGREALGSAGIFTGHSVGELAAAALSGAITADEAAMLVTIRGSAMAQAAAITETSMTAILGGDRDQVLAAIASVGATAANDNGPGQIVAAGTREQLSALAAAPPEKARLIELSVAGAFHTVHMSPAVAALAEAAESTVPAEALTPVISNRDGEIVTSGDHIVQRLVAQVAHPVRWDLCMEQMSALGITGLLELPPAGTLTGIARRALKGVETFALKSPDQLAEARAFCAAHAG